MKRYTVTGMTCDVCRSHVEKAVEKVPGVKEVRVSLLTNSMTVEGTAEDGDIIKAVEMAGYGARARNQEKKRQDINSAEEDLFEDRETPKLKKRLVFSAVFLFLLMYITMGAGMYGAPLPAFFEGNETGLALTQMLLALVVMGINRDFFVSGYRSLRQKAPNMDTLVALGSGVSFLWSLYVLYRMTSLVSTGLPVQTLYHGALYFESAAMIPALITVGKLLESLSRSRTTDALKSLARRAPKQATVERGSKIITIDARDVKKGDVFLVRPGEIIPADGVILEGVTTVDESALTGESVPSDKKEGDTVAAATINRLGFIKARALRVGEDTTFSQILQMVSDAAASKAPVARIADVVSSFFVPAVIVLSVFVAAVWLFLGATAVRALEHAISVLVISCPCALGLATPVAIMVGNGLGAKQGILFKTGEALENTGKLKTVVLDKTGTVTEGRPEVTDIFPFSPCGEEELLSAAYSLERKSEHPLAHAVVTKAEERKIPCHDVKEFTILPGNGIMGKIGERIYRGGSEAYISTFLSLPQEIREKAALWETEGKTTLFFETGGRLLGMIGTADAIRKDSARAVAELKKMGMKTVLLTGDNEKTAKAVGNHIGADRVIAEVLPGDKEKVIEELQKQGKTAMVGDGINDAPALTRAEIGIAMGGGTDVAIDAADVILMNSRLSDVVAAIRLSRATLKNVRQNLFWAFAYNLILIPVAAGVFPEISLNPMMAAGAMALSSVTVCLNALRLNTYKVHKEGGKNEKDGEISEKTEENKKVTVKTEEEKEMKETVKIRGMMCEHCENTVKKALEALPGVEKAEVSHETGTAVLSLAGEVDEETVRKAVEDKDYKFLGIEK
ncbi:MAG: heavy metal translocating P-type ATPase [Dialister sp.]|nr:heavy metal translocating P-type ATPase [Dialister sp.]